MLPYDELIRLGKEAGFTEIVPLRAEILRPDPEVRKMCEGCSACNARWSCPPGCGTPEQCRERILRYREGILVQTVRELEDELDGEGMMDAEALHKENFRRLQALLLPRYPGLLALGTGGCRICQSCTYPDAPCRFPERMVSSMEAYGLLVLQVCRDSGLRYYCGSKAIAYTGCFLLV